MSENNLVLEHIFEATALRLASEGSELAGACKWNDQGELYRICKCAVLRGPDDGTCKAGELMQYDSEIPMLNLNVPQNLRPECMLDETLYVFPKGGEQQPDGYVLDTDEAISPEMNLVFANNPPKGYSRGVWFMSGYNQPQGFYALQGCAVIEGYPQMADIALVAYRIPQEVNDFLTEAKLALSDFNTGLTITRTGRAPVLVMSTDDCLLYMPLMAKRFRESIQGILMRDGAQLFGDGWSEDKRQYNKLSKRKTTMARGLPNPIKPQGTSAQATQPAPAVAAPAPAPAQVAAPAPAPAPAAPARPAASPMKFGGGLLRRPSVAAPAPAPAPAPTPVAAPAAAQVPTQPVAAPAQAPVVQQADGTMPEVAAAVTAQVHTAVEPAPATVSQAPAAVQAEPEAAAVAEEPAGGVEQQAEQTVTSEQPAAAQPARRQRPPRQRPARAAEGIDYEKIIEMLSAEDIDYSADSEKGMAVIQMIGQIITLAAQCSVRVTKDIGAAAAQAVELKATLKSMLG